MHDRHGREYARLSELRVGETVEVDRHFAGFEKYRTVLEDDGRLWVLCNEGRHFLDGELTPDGSLLGVYKVATAGFNPEIAA
jgi:streptogramin lyase